MQGAGKGPSAAVWKLAATPLLPRGAVPRGSNGGRRTGRSCCFCTRVAPIGFCTAQKKLTCAQERVQAERVVRA